MRPQQLTYSLQARLNNTFTALNYPNYRLWFIGQIISLFGTWMQNTAQGYLVYELTGSPAYLGYVSFVSGVPSILMLLGGAAADRISKRTQLIITQTVMMLLAFILAALVFLKIVQPWHILVLSALLGITNAFDAPARLALAPELVDRDDLTNAIALNATMFNVGTVLGPTIAAIVYAIFGPAWCFMLNGVSFLAIIYGLYRMQLAPLAPRRNRASSLTGMLCEIGAEIMEGIRHIVYHNRLVATLMVVMAFNAMFGQSFIPLLPAWAVDVLGGDVTTNGLLRSAQGVGALVGALTIASLGRLKYPGRLLRYGLVAFPLLLMVFTFMRWLPLSMVFLAGMGFAIVLTNNLSNSLIQGNVSDELRGRVSSIWSLIFFGFMPLGSLVTGQIAEYYGEPNALRFGAGVLIAFVAVLLLRASIIRKLP